MDEDHALLVRARQLDADALGQIHDRYYPLIFRYIAFRVGDRHAAEDLTSDVFARFLSAVRDRNAPQNTLRGWLYGVASHVAVDYHRKRYRAPQVDLDDDLQSDEMDLDELLDNSFRSERLRQALTGLTEEQQNVIALRFGQGLPIHDVAHTMGKSEGAVKQLQARALAMLARKLSRGDEQ